MKYLKSEIPFYVLLAVLFTSVVLCSCANQEPVSIEGKINAVELSDDGRSARITIDGRTFLFTGKTFYIDSWGGLFSGRQNARISDGIVGRYCFAGWGKTDGETLLMLDTSGWQQPVFTSR